MIIAIRRKYISGNHLGWGQGTYKKCSGLKAGGGGGGGGLRGHTKEITYTLIQLHFKCYSILFKHIESFNSK